MKQKIAIFTSDYVAIYPLRGSICGGSFDKIIVCESDVDNITKEFLENIHGHLFDGGEIIYLDKYT